MKAVGIDIGSRYIKTAVVSGGGLVYYNRTDTSYDPLDRCRRLLDEVQPDRVVATGYGRHLLEVHGDIRTITEIKAFARGARSFFPACRTVIDIGGQDTKVISLSAGGTVSRFDMNDRCAAGTGKFLEVMARTLGFSVDDFGVIAATGDPVPQISSMCTVFAESEVTSLIARGTSREAIAVAVMSAVASRVAGMARRFSLEEVVFAGGCARNPRLRELLAELLGVPVQVAATPEITGALGAALYAEQEVA